MQLIGAVSSIDVCGAAPHDYCVSAGTRLHVYNGATSAAKRQFGRFKDRAYSGSFRQDGRLIVAGGEDSVVFDSSSRTLLRQFKGHKAPVHVAKFAEGQHVITGGDDGLVALWDVTSGQQVCTLRGHTDYVRYDHICKLWDVRQKRCLAGVDHGAPIESQLGRPLYARTAIAMAERLLSSCPATLDAGGVGLEHLERLEGAVAEELRTQEQLMGVQGMVSALVG
ncbi:hypothetical protein CHLNCDRAFT_139756 [Chlorella variabilis]|uniref:Uncharacterized protein n=1 Tax=Chlorella variabilis TaxID=554065 RepID=E1ZQW1_CHLVA|nr:hypothetical protein CHLNCDRAFT_139756 [Chlorella variabilis]EFN51794.1 hypothetical protein CHLNCDRAFT_139756 [Chlorella variabilis]|eukprot:XP_005843896.1 hypothetical protein CHLNCDRAFT_139756 [Chlorella variabilis]